MHYFRLTLLIVALVFPGLGAFGAETTAFDPDRFAAAQKEGRPILVEITAPWCPTCRAQQPIIERLTAAPDYNGLVIFRVDFDSQKDAVRHFGARSQSTLIAFRGSRETARSVGDTDETSIAALLRSTAR